MLGSACKRWNINGLQIVSLAMILTMILMYLLSFLPMSQPQIELNHGSSNVIGQYCFSVKGDNRKYRLSRTIYSVVGRLGDFARGRGKGKTIEYSLTLNSLCVVHFYTFTLLTYSRAILAGSCPRTLLPLPLIPDSPEPSTPLSTPHQHTP